MIVTSLRIFYTVPPTGKEEQLEAELTEVLERHGYKLNTHYPEDIKPHGIRDMRFDKGDQYLGEQMHKLYPKVGPGGGEDQGGTHGAPV